MTEFVALEELVAAIGDGAALAVPNDHAGVAMAATAAILARAPRHLQLICVPISGLQADHADRRRADRHVSRPAR